MNRQALAAVIALALFVIPTRLSAQSGCVIGGTYTDGGGHVMYCTGVGTAAQLTLTTELTTAVSTAVNAAVPAGLITMTLSSCPTGWAEATALNGVMLRGTLVANGNVGTTGGADSKTPIGTISWPAGVPTFTGSSGTVPAETFTGSSATSSAVSGGTPAGTNSVPTFSGSALATHAHELPWQIPSTTTIRQIAVATFGTGTSRAATAVSAAGTANTTSAAVALSQAISAGTPAGTVTAPTFTGSALATHTHTLTATGTNGTVSFTPVGTIAWPAGVPTLAGAALDVRPAYVNVIFCTKQ